MIGRCAALMILMTSIANADEPDGRYQALPDGIGFGIWIVDTRTGDVRFCRSPGMAKVSLGPSEDERSPEPEAAPVCYAAELR